MKRYLRYLSRLNRLTSWALFQHDDVQIRIACLARPEDWRPLCADWWAGKEVCVIGADIEGNFFLRHCDGSVRLWKHRDKKDILLAKSLDVFADGISVLGTPNMGHTTKPA